MPRLSIWRPVLRGVAIAAIAAAIGVVTAVSPATARARSMDIKPTWKCNDSGECVAGSYTYCGQHCDMKGCGCSAQD